MGSLKIIKPGILSLLQSTGRKGFAFYAIPKSGYLDSQSASYANTILSKPQNATLIECHIIPPVIEFSSDTQLVITGANFNWQINGTAINLNSIINVTEGDILKGFSAKNGSRGYITVNGEIHADIHYNSTATYTYGQLGGFNGRALRKGDIIHWDDLPSIDKNIDIEIALPKQKLIPFIKGPEYDWLDEVSKTVLFDSFFSITIDSNRMGARLKGSKLYLTKSQLKHSVPVLPGIIQLPPNGKAIVVLNDGQTTGGYPRIGYLPEGSLSSFNQLMIGENFGFSLINL